MSLSKAFPLGYKGKVRENAVSRGRYQIRKESHRPCQTDFQSIFSLNSQKDFQMYFLSSEKINVFLKLLTRCFPSLSQFFLLMCLMQVKQYLHLGFNRQYSQSHTFRSAFSLPPSAYRGHPPMPDWVC